MNEEELTPMVRRAEVTMEETSAGDGVGLGATTQAPEAFLTSLGKRGGQTVDGVVWVRLTFSESIRSGSTFRPRARVARLKIGG